MASEIERAQGRVMVKGGPVDYLKCEFALREFVLKGHNYIFLVSVTKNVVKLTNT